MSQWSELSDSFTGQEFCYDCSEGWITSEDQLTCEPGQYLHFCRIWPLNIMWSLIYQLLFLWVYMMAIKFNLTWLTAGNVIIDISLFHQRISYWSAPRSTLCTSCRSIWSRYHMLRRNWAKIRIDLNSFVDLEMIVIWLCRIWCFDMWWIFSEIRSISMSIVNLFPLFVFKNQSIDLPTWPKQNLDLKL